ncbi:MAG: hypothetical protein PVI21_02540 [Candidatus Woesebacteria bacterium]|jgi:hypothetical protein
MKITQKKKSFPKNIIIGIVIAILAIAAAAIFFFYSQRNSSKSSDINPVNTVNYDAPTEEEKTQNDAQKEQIINDYTESQEKSANTETIGVDGSIIATITRANQTGSTISIGILVEGTMSGTCAVSLSKEGQSTMTKTFDIIYEGTTSMCNNVSFPLSDLPESGEWLITATAKNDTSTSEPAAFKQNFYKN